ncbi:MAG: EF-P lysine aminoacylase EpmA [Myxococcales bacterium]|nr:EF-P lysine aminoacylase EpmA [Myxococcales bacterium]MDD9965993.1 EF-P lysine aminoacylase EpmA [Myxococcales bacterium]
MRRGERHRLGRTRIENLERRHRALQALRHFFDDRGFVEVETPAIVPSPGLDYHLEAFEVGHTGGPRYLHTSPEYQMKRLLAGGFERIYQICKAFRRDEQGTFHNPEFTMLEWYRTHAGACEVMQDTEELIASIVRRLSGGTTLVGTDGPIDVAPPFARMTVAQAFARYADVDVFEVLPDEERFFRLLIERIEPNLGREQPVFLTHYPASMASLARLTPEDPRFADRFETYVDGIELSNGFGELVDPAEQRIRLERDQARRRTDGRAVYPIDERFMAALEEGVPPSGGNALGVDRLVMLLIGSRDIADVMTFTTEEV